LPPGGLYMTKLWYNEPVGLETDPVCPLKTEENNG
jgi:hypothetical protein